MPPNNPMTEGEALAEWAKHYSINPAAMEALRNVLRLTAAQQPVQEGGGEVAAWMTPESIAHLAKQNGVAKVDAWNCASGSERVPVYTAPPSAPVGVGVMDEETALDAFDRACMANKRVSWHGYTRADRLKVMRRFLTALAQQPAQAAPGWKLVPVEPTDGMLTAYYEADRRRAPCTSGWRAMLAAAPTPPGDDAAGGGHGR